MSKKFFAVNRHTGKRWEPDPQYARNFLMMYDSGFLAEVREDFCTHISPLDPRVWEVVVKESIIRGHSE